MHPIEIIEFMTAAGILAVLLIASVLLKNKWRKKIWGLACLYLVGAVMFFVIRPHWIDFQIENKLGYLQEHLEEAYPGEEWQYRTLPHRENGHEHLNPYVIYVVFEKEPFVEYDYYVEDRHHITQVGYSSADELDRVLLHLEDSEE